MQRYIDQLIEDLLAKHKPETPPELSFLKEEDELEAHFEDVEKYLSGNFDQRIGDVLGLFAEQFPPVHRLTTDQMRQVSDAYAALLLSWNISAEMPEALPVEMAYELWVSTLDMDTFLPEDGFVTLEFCHYEPSECPFGPWCLCQEALRRELPDPEPDSDDFPF
jgi:hypothetical protein